MLPQSGHAFDSPARTHLEESPRRSEEAGDVISSLPHPGETRPIRRTGSAHLRKVYHSPESFLRSEVEAYAVSLSIGPTLSFTI